MRTATRKPRSWIDLPSPTTPEEERELSAIVRAPRTDYEEARNRLASAHLALVLNLAGRLAPRFGLDVDDAFGVGQIALIRAAEGYEAGKGKRFTTYAGTAIEREIQREANRSAGPVSAPVHTHTTRDNPYAEQARAARRPALDVDELYAAAPASDDDEPADFSALREWVARLPRRRREAIEAFYGLSGPPMTLSEIAAAKGTTREAVRCARDEGLRSLRKLAGVGGAA